MEDETNQSVNHIENLLGSIFHINNGSLSPIIKSTSSINSLISFLSQPPTPQTFSLLSSLIDLFTSTPYLCTILLKPPIPFPSPIFKILCELYMSNIFSIDITCTISSLLSLLLKFSDCPKETFSFIFRKIKTFFSEGEGDTNKCKLYLNECFNLLEILYGKCSLATVEPQNYLYFSGNGKIEMNVKDMSMGFGIKITLWINVKEHIDNCEIINVVLSNDTCFKLILKNTNELEIKVNDKESENLGVMIENNIWIQVNFIIKPRTGVHDKKKSIILSILECAKAYSNINENLNIKTTEIDENLDMTIKSITFLSNFNGMCSSILINYNGLVEQDNIDTLCYSNFPFGIYKESMFKEYLQSTKDNGYFSLFTPFSYSEEHSTIDDIQLISKAHIIEDKQTTNSIGVYLENNITDTIFFKGGINSLLPIAELLLTHKNGELIKEDNKEIFENYLSLINFILSNNRNNIIHANECAFFSLLAIFIEQYPSFLFSENIFAIFSNIAENEIKYSNSLSFIENICLNELVIEKFSIKIQNCLWEKLSSKLYCDIEKIMKLFKNNKIWSYLRMHDKRRIKEYCCKEHRDIYYKEKSENKPIMHPEMKESIKTLKRVIQIISGHYYKTENKDKEEDMDKTFIENNVYFFKLLSLEISPCLQKSIMEIYTNFFNNIRIDINFKKEVFKSLIDAQCIKILQYLNCVCSIDVKVQIIFFLDCITDNYWSILDSYFSLKSNNQSYIERDKFFSHIEDNILYDNFVLINNDTIIENHNDDIDITDKIHSIITSENDKETSPSNSEEDSYYSIVDLYDKKEYKNNLKEICEQFKHWFFQCCDKFNQYIKYKKKIKSFPYNLTVILNIMVKFLSSSRDIDLIEKILFLIEENISNKNILFPFLREFFPLHKNFRNWIIDIMFHSFLFIQSDFQSPWIDDVGNNDCAKGKVKKIYEMSKNIFFYMIKNKIPESVEYIDDLFKFEIALKGKVDKDKCYLAYRACGDFIKEVINIVLPDFIGYLTNHNVQCNKIAIMHDLLRLWHDYYFFFSDSEKIFKDINVFFRDNAWDDSEHIDLPKFIKSANSSLSSQPSNNDSIFCNIYKQLHSLWTIERLIELCSSKENEDLQLKDSSLFSPSDKILSLIVTELIFNQKKYTSSLFPELANVFVNDKGISLALLISHFLTALLARSARECEFVDWMNKYQLFIFYIIIQSSGYAYKVKKEDPTIQHFTDIILYNMCFIFNRALFYDEDKIKGVYREMLINIIRLLGWISEINANEVNKKIFKSKNSIIDIIPVFIIINSYVNENENDKDNFLFSNNQLKLYKDYPDKISNDLISQNEQIKLRLCLNEKIKLRLLNSLIAQCSFTFSNYDNPNQNKITIYNDYSSIYIKNLKDKSKCNIFPEEMDVFNLIKELKEKELYNIESSKAKKDLIRKNNLKKYRKIKKALFSWNGTWSDRDIFFTDKGNKILKFKVMNYLTREMTRPILTPILDLDYYLPKFKSFDLGNLFYKDKEIYKINLNLSPFVFSDKNIKSDNINNKEEKKEIILYQNLLPLKWNINQGCSNEQRKFKAVKAADKKHHIYLKCCLVKQTRHIKGKLYINKNQLSFKFNKKLNYEHNEQIDFYDKDRELCFGSFFPFQPKDEDFPFISIPYTSINAIFKRRYFYGYNSIEIYTSIHKSYFFKFPDNKNRTKILKLLLLKFKEFSLSFTEIKIDKRHTQNNEHIIGYLISLNKTPPLPFSSISSLSSLWLDYKISTFEFLMWINILSGRSYRDLTQYPIFPWLFDPIDWDPQKGPSLRNMAVPMGMIDSSEQSKTRLKSYRENYNLMKWDLMDDKNFESEGELNNYLDQLNYKCNEDLTRVPYFYGSHYSNATYVNYYMVRLFPYAETLIEIQGSKFDDPQRIFVEIKTSFFSATTQKCDVRELIPEFYYFPEMLINLNNFKFGEYVDIENSERTFTINDVILPKWSDGDPIKFISTMRKEFERNSNLKIQKWISLIFGDKQTGRKARESSNIFLPYTYEYMVDIEDTKWKLKENEEDKNFLMRYVEFGVTPIKTVFKDLPERRFPPLEFIDIKEYNIKNIQTVNQGSSYICNVDMFKGNKILITYNDFSQGIITISTSSHLKDCKKIKSENIKSPYTKEEIDKSVIKKLHDGNNRGVYCSYGEGKYTAIGGFWDGKIIIISISDVIDIREIEGNENKIVDKSAIVYIAIEKDDTFGYCGSCKGSIMVFEIREFIKWKLVYIANDHMQGIKCIYSNMLMNLFATCAYDGYINIYTKGKFGLIRSIYIGEEVDNIFISSRPLAVIVAYSEIKEEFIVYNINGMLIHKEKTNGKISCPCIYTSFLFCDYLLFQDALGDINVISLPYMEQAKKININLRIIKWMVITESKQGIIAIDKENNINVIC